MLRQNLPLQEPTSLFLSKQAHLAVITPKLNADWSKRLKFDHMCIALSQSCDHRTLNHVIVSWYHNPNHHNPGSDSNVTGPVLARA